jgi:colicin import membrane protein
MKATWILAVVGMVLGTSAWSQQDAAPGVDSMGAERHRIDSIRQQKTAELDAQDAACLSKFAVNDCRNKVSARRRKMLADLKREEIRLNAAERLLKEAEQRKRSDEKAAERAQRQAESGAPTPSATQQERQQAQDEKIRNRQKPVPGGQAKASGPKVPSGLDADTAAKNREAYVEKQKEAEKRRQEREQRLRDHGPGAGLPLPVAK